MMTHDTSASLWAAVPVLAAAGFAVGVAYFASLRRGVRLSTASHAWLPYMLWALARIVAAALFFMFAVRWGMPALLAAFAGFLFARLLALRGARGVA